MDINTSHMTKYKVLHANLFTSVQGVSRCLVQVSAIIKLIPYFSSMSAATAVVMLPTDNQVKLTNPHFLTVCVLIINAVESNSFWYTLYYTNIFIAFMVSR